VISLLTNALDRISGLEIEVSELRLPALGQYRSAAFRLMRALSADDLAEQFAEDRVIIGRHVSATLRLPEDWDAEWLQRVAQGEAPEQFVRRLQRETDDHIGELAAVFVRAADDLRQGTEGLNPMRVRCRQVLDELAGRSFLVLLQRPYPRCRQLYSSLDARFTGSTLCTEPDLRQLDRFVDVLITTGRFDRFTPDHILTAPRWQTIVNIRWAGDADDREDFPLFPSLRLEQLAPGDRDTPAPRTPVTITRSVRLIDHTPGTGADPRGGAGHPHEGTEWNAITFDDWYLGRRHRLHLPAIRQTERPPGYSGLAVYVGTADGGGIFVPISEDGRARSLLAFDPLEDAVGMRRPSLDPEAPGDRGEHLEEGMMLVLPEEAIEVHDRANTGPRVRGTSDRMALKSAWKQELASLIRRDGASDVAARLKDLDVSLVDLPASVQRWARDEGINAPRSEDHFRALVRDLLGMRDEEPAREQQSPWWERAWDAVRYERGLNISLGLLEENARERAVKQAILAHLDLVTEAARRSTGVTIPVGAGEGKVRVVTVEFIVGGQGDSRFRVPEIECLRYLEPHEARLRWLARGDDHGADDPELF
jgi:hypothetical protein